MLGYLTTSDHQLWRVWVLETSFGLLIRLLQSYTFVTTVTYKHLLRCVTFTELTILHANIPFLTSSHTLRNPTANCMPPHSLRKTALLSQSHIATDGQSVSQ
jgi:hypothetical protein